MLFRSLADLKGGDIVLARLSVSGKAARADVKAGTPVPVGELVDRGQPPAPPANKPAPVPAATPPPPVTPPVFYPRFQGPVTGVSSNLVTVLVGDVGNQHSVTLDLTGVTVYDVATKSPEAVSAIQVGDVVQARSAVTAGVASSDVQAGTPVPVSAAYDLGQTPTAS